MFNNRTESQRIRNRSDANESMEGVGARFGRSSTRYGPATVFTGPVRKWKKKWVHVSPSNTGSSNTSNHSSNNNNTNNHHSPNGTSNGKNVSHLLLFKWTPLSQSQNNTSSNNDSSKDDDVAAPQEPPRRKFKYIPIAVLEEQKNEAAENIDDEAKPREDDPSAAEPASRNDGFDEKPDINDAPMDESQEDTKIVRQDLNESALDLSLG
ncbi:Formyl transferase [Hibiscus syriacus]|uniref:Formyl transferase n=1 Tax=Hibiscus syriacus TaxID=106335 RepID=A0A6A3C1T7_HIBSY|nr:putative uncharacterized protein DDB_G0285119 [Hibiscus syriacus]KAE8723095.1 Formyl transferase [Hibiscus syriacus]